MLQTLLSPLTKWTPVTQHGWMVQGNEEFEVWPHFYVCLVPGIEPHCFFSGLAVSTWPRAHYKRIVKGGAERTDNFVNLLVDA